MADTKENDVYLKEQILTYLGNKRSLLNFINQGVDIAKKELFKDKLSVGDLFSGSGIVSRNLKQHASYIVANDLELYSKITNECYLFNADFEFKKELLNLNKKLNKNIQTSLRDGFLSRLYAPLCDDDIKDNERVFYTRKNANFLDTARQEIDGLDEDFKKFFIAPLLYEASNKANTSGVFKGFYKNKDGKGEFGGSGKNALKRIMADIVLPVPVFSNFNVKYDVFNKDSNELANELDELDLIYLDPPYNQHPYGSNYFMLNLIAKYDEPKEISKVSGITKDWNRSAYNKKAFASDTFFELIAKLKAKFILISFNSEGFISREKFEQELCKFGKVKILEQKYNTFKASRNLKNRQLHVIEYLYILKKQNKE
ncbi:DNA adenine methylase [Campylobacter pinnipediorum]|uniref:DNA adenine methylase n=1 Tax=Campylobacter pinnipediorum TaxID=1965231 RepID=UPI00084DE1BD|nr:DNA adenine methylase [Campylobacter pinnipediorum]AQW83525.1 adenine-specific DNA methyltransferase (EcoRI methylase) [Campylobacter pinnipediorum subsp. pinnipediorum]